MSRILDALMKREGEPSMTRRVELVSRVSAYQWRRVEVIANVVGWALLALMVPFIVLAMNGQGWATFVAGVLGTVGFTAIGFYSYGFASDPTGAREEKAGYTTILLPYQPEIDLVAPKTGFLIRAAGEKQLSERDYRAALLEARKRV